MASRPGRPHPRVAVLPIRHEGPRRLSAGRGATFAMLTCYGAAMSGVATLALTVTVIPARLLIGQRRRLCGSVVHPLGFGGTVVLRSSPCPTHQGRRVRRRPRHHKAIAPGSSLAAGGTSSFGRLNSVADAPPSMKPTNAMNTHSAVRPATPDSVPLVASSTTTAAIERTSAVSARIAAGSPRAYACALASRNDHRRRVSSEAGPVGFAVQILGSSASP
jgi:hypothetical protein